MPPSEVKILSPTAILGYGFPEASFAAGMRRAPDVIAVDAGSTDPGPYYLGAGASFTAREAVKRDLRLILAAARAHRIPVLIGSAGGAGARPHVAWTADIVSEVAREQRLRLKLAIIHADIPKRLVRKALADGALVALPPAPPADQAGIDASTHIVGQMGIEPFARALDAGADVILAGRAYDPAVFAAVPIRAGFDPALALHLGKILECAAIAAHPGSGSDCMLGTLRRDHFLVEPLAPERVCTVTSVAAHTLYEKSDPYRLPGPGGMLDLTETTFAQATPRAVRVAGTRYIRNDAYTVKVEAARPVGFRTVAIAGARDPIFIARVDEILDAVRRRVADNFAVTSELHDPDMGAESVDYRLLFHLYGKNAVMGLLEPVTTPAHELGILIETVARTQDRANTICAFARSTLLHIGYAGRVATAGNLAFPYSPSDFKAGEVYEFSLYHLLTVADPCALFPVEYVDL